jgi:hypothetical protein
LKIRHINLELKRIAGCAREKMGVMNSELFASAFKSQVKENVF